jgi:predicted AlkP superfamily phosphohydrolase/phosphomutase
MDMTKLLIIGIDGGSFNVLEPLIEKGALPNLSSFSDAGVSGPLESVIPPYTASAWSTFMTGKNPGMHGLFDFIDISKSTPGTQSNYLVSSRSLKESTLWERLSESKKRIVAINVPMTYPAIPLNGVMISGMLATSLTPHAVYPPERHGEFVSRWKEYTMDLPATNYDRIRNDTFVKKLRHMMEVRSRSAEDLLKEEDWDLFTVVFTAADRLQHGLWDHIEVLLKDESPMDDGDPLHREILRFYRSMDRIVGTLTEAAGPDATVLIISDHGFGSFEGRFYMNLWLEQNGYLRINHLKRWAYERLKKTSKWVRTTVVPAGKTAGVTEVPGREVQQAEGHLSKIDRYFNPITWSRTKCYTVPSVCQGIYINLEGREERGIVGKGNEYRLLRQQLADRLKEVIRPGTDRPLFSHIYFSDEILNGPYARYAPDLILLLDGCRCLINARFSNSLYIENDTAHGTGTHRLHGILFARGPGIRRGKIEGAKLIDIAPTVFHLLQEEVPGDLEGAVLEGIFEPAILKKNPVRITHIAESTANGESGRHEYTREEQEEIENRLRGIGYLE